MKTHTSKETCRFVVFDVETTGLSPGYGDRIIEIGALQVNIPLVIVPGSGSSRIRALDIRRLTKGKSFSSLVKVDEDISYGAFLVNRITPAMLQTAPRAEKILPEFLKFIAGSCLIGHNVRFDLGFLLHELSLAGLTLPEVHFMDTVRLARRLLPELRRYSLASLIYFLGIDRIQEHRAMSDVELTYLVFRSLLAIADRRDLCTHSDLLQLCGGRHGRKV